MPCVSDITNINVKGVDYCYMFHDISRSEAIHLIDISALDNHGYI